MDVDLDTLATALYVRTDDLLNAAPEWAPWHPSIGILPKISDAELVTLSVMQALLGHTSEARWLRYARAHPRHLFPYLPQQPGYNKRLRRLGRTIGWLVGVLARDTTLWTDDVWVVDSTPVECARSREAALRSDLAGWAEYGYRASHSRYFWGLRGAPAVHAARAAGRVRPDRREGRRTPNPARDLRRRPHVNRRAARADRDRGQKLLSAASSRPPSPRLDWTCCAPLARASPHGPEPSSSSHYGRSSSPSTTPSKASSTSNSTAATHPPGSGSASRNASWPRPPRSGTTTTPANRSNDHSWPTTTDPLESII